MFRRYNKNDLYKLSNILIVTFIVSIVFGQVNGRSCSLPGDDCLTVDVILLTQEDIVPEDFLIEIEMEMANGTIPKGSIELLPRNIHNNNLTSNNNTSYAFNSSRLLSQDNSQYFSQGHGEISLDGFCSYFMYELRIRTTEDQYDEDLHTIYATEYQLIKEIAENYGITAFVISPQLVGATDGLIPSRNQTNSVSPALSSNIIYNSSQINPKKTYVAVLDTGIMADSPNNYAMVNGFILEDEGYSIDGFVTDESPYHGQAIVDILNKLVPNNTILGLKVCHDNGRCYPGDVIVGTCAAINFVAESNSDSSNVSNLVLNYSMNTSRSSELFTLFFSELIDRGINIVASSGNMQNHRNCDNDFDNDDEFGTCEVFPTNVAQSTDGIISVGAITDSGTVWNENLQCLEIECNPEFYAWGVDIPLQYGNEVFLYTGTSYASPYIAGIVTLLKNGGYDSADIQQVLLDVFYITMFDDFVPFEQTR